MKQIEKYLKSANATLASDGEYNFEPSVVSVMSNENMWYDLITSFYIKIDKNVKAYISIGGHMTAGYFKTDGQRYCVSTHFLKDDKCYTGRVLLGYTQTDVLNNVKKIVEDISNYNSSEFEINYDKTYGWQKAIAGELVSHMESRLLKEKQKAETEEKVKENPENALLIRILEIARRKRENCYCTESQVKFNEIVNLIIESNPSLK